MSSEDRAAKLAGLAFDEGYDRASKAKAEERDPQIVGNMKDGAIERLIAAFENASQIDDDGVEFWTARELQSLLGYSKWDNFLEAIQKAKEACKSVGQKVLDHFADVGKMVSLGSGAGREISDFRLTRYACYLIAQNGDARKKPIAFAQTYFAIQTRRQEIRDDEESQYAPLSEDQKRCLLREEIKDHNKRLASTAKGAGADHPSVSMLPRGVAAAGRPA